MTSTPGPAASFFRRTCTLAGRGHPDAYWREQMSTRPFSAGLQDVAEDSASRAWLQHLPRGWTGRDFIKAVHLRTANLATKGLPTGCPFTHYERIGQHNEIVNKIATHVRRRRFTVEKEPRIYHPDKQLFIPDLAIHLPDNEILVTDVQVCWEDPRPLSESWTRRKLVYDHPRFREAAARRWPGRPVVVEPILLGARGVWPSCNHPTAALIAISHHLKASCVNSCLKKISFRAGVKQGDPLSPALFNAVLDGLITELNEKQPGGTLSPSCKIAALAFADDLLLLEDRDLDIPNALQAVEDFLRTRGIALNPAKCSSISAATVSGKSVPRTKPSFKIHGHYIKPLAGISNFRYLGLMFGSTGAAKPTLFNLTNWLSNLQQAPLRPSQKFDILKAYLVPRLLYGLQSPGLTGELLQECDRDGGLGLPQLRYKLPCIFSRRLENLKRNCDDITNWASIFNIEGPAQSLYYRLRVLPSRGDPDPYWREETTLRPYSAGLQDVADDASSRAWIHRVSRGWTGRDYGCPLTHYERIGRHNEIVAKIAKHARRKGWITETEPRVYHPDGQLYKPDLAIHQPGNTISIVDVQVCWEGPRTLATSWDNKRLVYDNVRFREAAVRHWGDKNLILSPLLLGARGIWPRCNQPTTGLLSIPSPLRSSCVHTYPKWGSTIHRRFIAGVWRRRPPEPPARGPKT
ncbi:Reverse transcriptase (RNA-dependent DNA polymerase) [Popillia japonica]|uniref:Reverse transcriptase (RNA-dependent DNA polymerase) n=1 Tax=Popillia japonica TaxID=7064 RepID=A0AAW1MJR0_POPJA